MYSKLYGNFLLDKGYISKEQYQLILEKMNSIRVKLGLIAVEKSFMTHEQTEEVNRIQAMEDKRFGDIAVEKGFLTQEQVSVLLKMQGNPYMQFTQVLVDNEILSLEKNAACLKEYQEENGFSNEEMEIIKSGDADMIVPILVKIDDQNYMYQIGLAIRNIIRFVSTDVAIMNVERVKEYKTEHFAYQCIKSDPAVCMGFAGNGNSLLIIAETFGEEEFGTINADAYDAVCEFTNCINGLFALKLDKESIEVEMLSPLFADNANITASDGEFYVVTVDISGNTIDLILSIGTDLIIE